ncbi:hypothetical protein CRI70_01165 [Streptomyces sp. Ru87]|nr:hypothetical protein CRI70_01165 [Streptomyces sp. Ru87]
MAGVRAGGPGRGVRPALTGRARKTRGTRERGPFPGTDPSRRSRRSCRSCRSPGTRRPPAGFPAYGRRAACGVRRAACGVRRAACGVRRAACGRGLPRPAAGIPVRPGAGHLSPYTSISRSTPPDEVPVTRSEAMKNLPST